MGARGRAGASPTSRAEAMVIRTADPAIPINPVRCRERRPARSTTNSCKAGVEKLRKFVVAKKSERAATLDHLSNYSLESRQLEIK